MGSYEMVVRHHAQGETLDALAQRFDLPVDTVKTRIRRFIELLPKDDRGGALLKRRADLLRFAASS